jgi:O-antigen ligase
MGSISLYQELTGSYDNDFGGLAQVKEAGIDTGEVDYLGKDIERRRLAGPIGSKNRYAQVMVVLLPLAIFRVWAERSWLLRMLAAAACVPILSGALLTFSRGAGISIVITLLIMVFLRTIKLWHFFAIALVGCLVVLVAIPHYVYRISTVSHVAELASGDIADTGSSVRGRATENLASINIFLDHPILGVGPGQTNLYSMEYANQLGLKILKDTRRAHNMYLEELADTGVLGFISFMSIVLFTMYQLVKVRRRWARSRPDIGYTATGFLLAIIAYLSTAVFLHLSYVRYYWFLLALAGAAVHIFRDAPLLEAGESDADAAGATQGAPRVRRSTHGA